MIPASRPHGTRRWSAPCRRLPPLVYDSVMACTGDVMKRWIGFTAGMLIAGLVMAQTWPSKPIRIVIAQAHRSATDVISRLVDNQLSVNLRPPIVLDAPT